MSDPAYQLGHEHFCEVDVVPTITSAGRWAAWPMPISIGEEGLASLATAVRLDRQDHDAAQAMGFPVLLETTPATFCSGCLRWFSTDHDHEGLGPQPQDEEQE